MPNIRQSLSQKLLQLSYKNSIFIFSRKCCSQHKLTTPGNAINYCVRKLLILGYFLIIRVCPAKNFVLGEKKANTRFDLIFINSN